MVFFYIFVTARELNFSWIVDEEFMLTIGVNTYQKTLRPHFGFIFRGGF